MLLWGAVGVVVPRWRNIIRGIHRRGHEDNLCGADELPVSPVSPEDGDNPVPELSRLGVEKALRVSGVGSQEDGGAVLTPVMVVQGLLSSLD